MEQGKINPNTFKVSIGYKAFYLGEGEISYAGSKAYERAQIGSRHFTKKIAG